MATKRQVQAARRNVRLALAAARRERLLAGMALPGYARAETDEAATGPLAEPRLATVTELPTEEARRNGAAAREGFTPIYGSA